MGTDGNARRRKGGQAYRAGSHKRRGNASGKVSAAAPVFIAVILAVGGIIGVGRTGKAVCVITAAGVLVGDHNGDWSAGGAPAIDAAEYLIVV